MLQAIGLPEPRSVNGVKQIPIEGTSLVYSFEDGKAKERRTTQYFEIAGNRAIYHEGWFARTIHKAPWEAKPRRTLQDNSAWELYDVRSDFSLAHDLAAQNPKKLAEMQKVFMQEAAKYGVLPMDDRFFERLDPAAVGRPDLMGTRTSMTLAEGMTGMMEGVFVNVKNRSKTITAEVEVPANGGHGTVIAQGGRFGGWSLYVKDGVPGYDYNFLGMQRTSIVSSKKLGAGKAELRFQFDYDGGGPAKGGQGTLFVNGEKVAEGRIPATQLGIFSADETADVGIGTGLDRHDLAHEIIVCLGDARGVGALHTFDQHFYGAVGQLEHLQDAGHTTHVEHVVRLGLVLASSLLRHQHDLAPLFHGRLESLDGLGPAHEQRDHHVRKHHDIPQRQQRQRDRIGRKNGMAGH